MYYRLATPHNTAGALNDTAPAYTSVFKSNIWRG